MDEARQPDWHAEVDNRLTKLETAVFNLQNELIAIREMIEAHYQH